eukprot:CAMPEP_0170543514 /NCGR_PEP_ID=MMETSP0211-20121228/2609_1 /TAXON_ID=311385 /ORGANISM="Pseudokeronopsis sp., Strain OXSARD2" /LENGTH=206 /DNA_ID=CAMNT_0010846913 /DNA_START=549 /DNA_END=1166 /DNA_ORIENTATION=+
MQVESYKSNNSYFAAFLDEEKQAMEDKRQKLLSDFEMGDMKKKYKIPNLIKPFFIIFNIFTYLAYFAICVYFLQLRSEKSTTSYQAPSDMEILKQYYRAISGLNGLMFLMLGLAMLNYGGRLETLISQTKQKGPLNANNGRGLDSEVQRNFKKQYIAINETSKRILHGLDLRIFLITICLSILFFIVSISEFLQAWSILTKTDKQW